VVALLVFLVSRHEKKLSQARTREAPQRKNLVKQSQDQELQKFSLTGYDDKGKTFWNLIGETAKIEAGQSVLLDQNVTLKLQGGTVIQTQHVQWSQEAGVLRTSSPVYVNHQNAKVKGMGAIGRPNESFIQLNRNIEMVINQTTRLTCEGPMKIFYKQNKMIFYRKVKVTDERGTLTANRMDVLFDPTERKIDQIIAIGNVTIERGPDVTRSGRAIYSVATGAVRLEGNPEITLHKDSIGLVDGAIRN
jgi:LPS export ABC transporter protein LptC